MSYTRRVGSNVVYVDCIADPEGNYYDHKDEILVAIKVDGYEPKTTYDNLICMVILSFDCDDNYPEWGDEFTTEMCLEYVKASGGWKEFDYYA